MRLTPLSLLMTLGLINAQANQVNHPIKEPVLCSASLNLYCPSQMKCCPQYSSTISATERKLFPSLEDTIVGYSCLGPSHGHYPIGECCNGDTGCSVGYTCAAATNESTEDELATVPHCQLDSSQNPTDNYGEPIDFQFVRMPRYHTCPARNYVNYKPFGLPIPSTVARQNGRKLKAQVDWNVGQLAYYTSRKSLDVTDEKVKTVIITVHGSSRVSTNYLCFMMRTVQDYVASKSGKMRDEINQTDGAVSEEEYLVIAPWFLAPEDGHPESSSDLPYLKWDDHHPISHTFRYGAESLPVDGSNTVSSFAALDVLLETLCAKQSFPNLEKIVVAGHSAGGQVVHRWGVSSSSWCLDTNENESHPNVKLVAANPRSYVYLDGRRYFSTDKDDGDEEALKSLELRELTSQERDDCPGYNSYAWGLADNTELPAPYFISNLAPFEDANDKEVFCRYAARDVTYLSGERDVETLGNQICNEDGYQGPTRRQRSERFYASLQVIGKEAGYCGQDEDPSNKIHDRVLVKNVGHDHALIFLMEEGLRVLFE